MSIPKTEAIVLNKRDFRETSLIVDFYTRDFGKISGLLKGIRADPRKFASTLEPYSFNEIIFYKKRNSALHLVSQCDLRHNYNVVRKDIMKSANAILICELIHSVMGQEDKNEDIFNLAKETLEALESNSSHTEKITLIFKIKLLTLSGFQPHFESCVSCGTKITQEAKFSLSQGGLLCSGCFPKDTHARTIFRGTIASILHIQKNDMRTNLNLGLNPEIKKELSQILHAFFSFHLEKDFRAERVLKQLRSLEPAIQ
ncbi:MAG: DNA repair protein RecO [Candidatus Omnitrophica bacterium]|nr:DNA repair protein RecO [Candidatus Omnitrophota bacterium]